MMRILFTIAIFHLICFNSAFGQELQIKVNLESAANKEVYLAHYYISNIYVDDTIQLDANGFGILKRDTLLPQGLYKIYMNDKNHFDFILGADQDFELSNKTFSGTTIVANGAIETEEFIKYMNFFMNLKLERTDILNNLKSATGENKKILQNKLSDLTPQLYNYWEKINDKYPKTFLSSFLMSSYIPELDVSTLPIEIQQNDSLLLLAKFRYQQNHYWDYFDYTDERFLYTPLLQPKLETWFTKILYQNYDSVQPKVFRFIENVQPHKRIFQYAVSWFLNSSINSKVMGMDALFVDIAQAYYFSGKAYWANEESMKKIRENVMFLENNLIGKIAPDLTLENVDGEFYNLYQIEKKRTCVLIYEPNCSHCREFVPQFYKQVYQKYKDKGLEVFAIYSMDNKEEWTEFLLKHELWDWINVWDKNHTSQFKILYDGRITPGIFVLDENKRIIAKKLTVKQIDQLMQHDLN
ncbi:redoxin domain-containing protein [Draconibacterium sp.]|nr:redoxin domain-containing protein [Draconibacterium sp.]